ncbi:MAG: hypothetical protein ACHQQQ_12420 [Bacteroidota bacterium]
MLGFNKYIIPFQRSTQHLPFNVAGLDTLKYTNDNFERYATQAIDQAIEITKQNSHEITPVDQIFETFLMSKKTLMVPLNTEGDRTFYELGRPLGFNLLNDFTGFNYFYCGLFTALRSEIVLWRLTMLNDILLGRVSTIPERVKMGLIKQELVGPITEFIKRVEFWVIVNGNKDKEGLLKELNRNPLKFTTQIFSVEEIQSELNALSDY